MTLMESQRHAEHSESQLQEEWTVSTIPLHSDNLCTISPPVMVFPLLVFPALLVMALVLNDSAAGAPVVVGVVVDDVDPLECSANVNKRIV